MIKLNEENIKSQDRLKTRPPPPVSQIVNAEPLIMNFRTFKRSLECPTLFWVVNTYTSFKGQLKNPLVYETLLAPFHRSLVTPPL